jgi:uncharacterized membrane protein YgdD (TMEM256/DUF423 family)
VVNACCKISAITPCCTLRPEIQNDESNSFITVEHTLMVNIEISLFSRWVLAMGAVCALLAVILGAFAAHGLKAMLDAPQLEVFTTAARYQMYHAFALLIVGLLSLVAPFSRPLLQFAAGAFSLGILLFCGSLYLLALGGPAWLGPITPLGGGAFLLGWLLILIAVMKPATDPG